MPYAIVKVNANTQEVHRLFLTDAVRQANPFLASILRREKEACIIGEGRFRRYVRSTDILEWAEEQDTPWHLSHITSSFDSDVVWTYLYLRQDIEANARGSDQPAETTPTVKEI